MLRTADMVAIVLITALIALAFSFTNGMNDAANCIASVVATKALPPKLAVFWAAVLLLAWFARGLYRWLGDRFADVL